VIQSGSSHNPNLGRDPIFADPWYNALNAWQQS